MFVFVSSYPNLTLIATKLNEFSQAKSFFLPVMLNCGFPVLSQPTNFLLFHLPNLLGGGILVKEQPGGHITLQ